MCLYIKSSYHPEGNPLKAKKPIYTLKIAKHYKNRKGKPSVKAFYQGNIQYLKEKLKAEFGDVRGVIHEGLHSLNDPLKFSPFIKAYSEDCVLLCEIPKGANYFVGQEGDIVSDTLILKEVLVNNASKSKTIEIKNHEYLPYKFYLMDFMLEKALAICASYKIKIGL